MSSMNCFWVDGNQHPAQPLDHQPIIQQAGRHIDASQIDFHARPARRQVRRNRRHKFVDLVQRAVRSDSRQPHHRYAVRSFKRSRLNRLPINSIQRRAKQRRQRRLPDAGIRPGNKEMMSHACLADCSLCFCVRTLNSPKSCGEGSRRPSSAFRRGKLHRWQLRGLLPAKNLFSWAPVYTGLFPALAMKACYHRFAIVFRPHICSGIVLYTSQIGLAWTSPSRAVLTGSAPPAAFDPPLR